MTWLRELQSKLKTQISNPVRGAVPSEREHLLDAVNRVSIELLQNYLN